MSKEGEKLYPHCDLNVWLRTCEEEVSEPLEGNVIGEIPSWIRGTLLRNGPGATHVGTSQFKHVFDGSALLHRFAISDGSVNYQCRFVRSNTLNKNHAANRILFAEFGTKAVPDPCHTIFDRLTSVFKLSDSLSDNTLVSVYPFGDEIYCLTEAPIIHRIDPVTLETMERKNLDTYVVNHTAHPHIMANGDIYNLGMTRSGSRLKYAIVKFPFTKDGDMFEKAHIVCTVRPRWPMHPSYMHSFGITENYFVLIEQPLCLSLRKVIWSILRKNAIAATLQWFPDKDSHIVLVDRRDGSTKRYRTKPLAFFHIINTFELDGKLVLDLVTYKDAKLLQAFYTKAIKGMQSNKEFASWCRSRPKRIDIPLNAPDMTKLDINLLADISCEFPKINYEKFNGLPYRYCYGVGADVDTDHALPIVKIDLITGEPTLWYETGWSPGEPIFIACPDAQAEDDGVLVSAMVRECPPRVSAARELALLVLDARTLQERGRALFRTPSPAPQSLHGWFLPTK